MSTTSMYFLLFMVVLVLLYYNVKTKHRWIILLTSNIIFYYLSCGIYTIYLLIAGIFAYIMGILIKKKSTKLTIFLSIIYPIGVLITYKYLNFFREIIVFISEKISINLNITEFKLIAPLGISFFTLQIISYLVDVYRGNIDNEKHIGKFLAYITFFATIVSGPIERYHNFKNELSSEKSFDYNNAVNGLLMIFFGMFKKLIIADRIGNYVGSIYGDVYSHYGFDLILASALYALQLYADFSGYIDISRGAAKILGINLMENFNFPYISKSVQEFWGKWHISLSSWLKDYIYIPLGGSRVGNIRKYINIIIVFLVSGLWHGANLTFIVWGLLHGVYQVIERLISNYKKEVFNNDKFKLLKIGVNFILVDIAWIFFRAPSIEEAWYVITHLFAFKGFKIALGKEQFLIIFVGLLILMIVEYILYNNKYKGKFIGVVNSQKIKWCAMFILIIMVLILKPFSTSDFIYGMF